MNKRTGQSPAQRPGPGQNGGQNDSRTGEATPELLHKALAEMEATHEELRVAEEEMQVQNEALATAALALDAERRRYRDLFHAAPEPSLLTNLVGKVEEANLAAHTLLGAGPKALIGKPLAVFVALQSRHNFRTEILGRPGVHEHGVYLQPRHGALLYVTVRVSPVPNAGGKPVGLRWVVRGITPDPGAELARYRRLVDDVTDFAIFTFDAQGLVTAWNAGAELIFGFSPTEILGRTGDVVFTPEDRAAGAPDQERSQARATGRAEDERWHIRKDGTRFWGSGVMTAMPEGPGQPIWYAKIVRDATARRLHEQREHAVATQLQAAVQPDAPPTLPGLAVRTFYRPALAEASVGGDFFDAFALGDGRSVIAVGDVSGKGLEAASQVAMVRNMLRFALYNGRTVAGPVAAVNHTLVAHALLPGFVTLFVGVYDPQTRILSYVNCGQEAALLRRAATGQIEALRFTSPLVGVAADSEFAEDQTTLAPGDVLTIFTDGLTDIGSSRMEMLGEDGVIRLLQGADAALSKAGVQEAAELVTNLLIQAVDAQGAENVPDDVCLLVAAAE